MAENVDRGDFLNLLLVSLAFFILLALLLYRLAFLAFLALKLLFLNFYRL